MVGIGLVLMFRYWSSGGGAQPAAGLAAGQLRKRVGANTQLRAKMLTIATFLIGLIFYYIRFGLPQMREDLNRRSWDESGVQGGFARGTHDICAATYSSSPL